jgi:hypothetical protein
MGSNTFTDNGSQAFREMVATRIRLKAQSYIVGIVGGGDGWMVRQINILARSAELERKDRQEGLTEAEVAELAAFQGLWVKVKAIRVYSNQLEAAFLAGQTVDISTGWPQ